MTRAVWFWVIFVLAVIFSGYWHFRGDAINYIGAGMTLVEFVLIGLLGWQSYGPPIKD